MCTINFLIVANFLLIKAFEIIKWMVILEVFMFSEKRALVMQIIANKALFFIAGFCISAWAPLVPYVKSHFNLDSIELSKLILLMGLGSLLGMCITNFLFRFLGAKFLLNCSCFLLLLSLIMLSVFINIYILSFFMFCFGLALGLVEVGANIYGSYLEQKTNKVLMSIFHGYYSAGECLSILVMMFFLYIGFDIYQITLLLGGILSFVAVYKLKHIQSFYISYTLSKETTIFSLKNIWVKLPKSLVLSLAVIVAIMLMIEGAMLDWSAVFLYEKTAIDIELASSGYIVLVLFMAIGRFSATYLLKYLCTKNILFLSLSICCIALFIIGTSKYLILIYIAFALLGIGLANILPLAISIASKQKFIKSNFAITFVSSSGYVSLIIGPAFVGSISQYQGLSFAFIVLAILTLLQIIHLFLIRRQFR